MSLKQDLENRLSVIQELEHQILQESVRFLRMKKLNQLMSARENLILQFYNDNIIQNTDILKMLENEAQDYIFFITSLTTKFSKSNTEFSFHLQSILNTCEHCKSLNTKKIISTANDALAYISLHTRENKNIMTSYRLRNLQRCKTLLNQYAEKKIDNRARSLDACVGLDKEGVEK